VLVAKFVSLDHVALALVGGCVPKSEGVTAGSVDEAWRVKFAYVATCQSHMVRTPESLGLGAWFLPSQ